MSDQWKFETQSVHAGYTPEPTTKAVAVPIYQTVAYAFDSAQHGADLFDLKVAGNIYSRIMNPTCDVLEKRVAAWGGTPLAVQRPGDHGRSRPLRGGVINSTAIWRHLQPVCPRCATGITTRFADHRDHAFAA